MDILPEIKKEETKKLIYERTGCENPDRQGLTCPHCGAREVYANDTHPDDTTKWAWLIRAFRVDDASECRNCERWFVC